MMLYLDDEALAAPLRPGNAGANTAADQIAAADLALAQIPAEHIAQIELLVRGDTAAATHDLIDWCREARIGFSVGYELTESVREAILNVPDAPMPRAGLQSWVGRSSRPGATRSAHSSGPLPMPDRQRADTPLERVDASDVTPVEVGKCR